MKFSSHLTEAILLKRVMRFMAEIVLPNRQKAMIRCPNIGDMRGNDTLGTKIWYSSAIGYHCLPTWELSEADGGFLVCINPELMKPLVIDSMKRHLIHELSGYNILHAGGAYDQFRSQFLLLEKDQKQCYVGIEQVIRIGANNAGIFPVASADGLDNLRALVQAKEDGHRAILLFCVMHSGVEHIKLNEDPKSEYNKLLARAMALDVEVVAYRAAITLESIELATQVPILHAERAAKFKL
jgi:sugar fermentation stimulation protein A